MIWKLNAKNVVVMALHDVIIQTMDLLMLLVVKLEGWAALFVDMTTITGLDFIRTGNTIGRNARLVMLNHQNINIDIKSNNL